MLFPSSPSLPLSPSTSIPSIALLLSFPRVPQPRLLSFNRCWHLVTERLPPNHEHLRVAPWCVPSAGERAQSQRLPSGADRQAGAGNKATESRTWPTGGQGGALWGRHHRKCHVYPPIWACDMSVIQQPQEASQNVGWGPLLSFLLGSPSNRILTACGLLSAHKRSQGPVVLLSHGIRRLVGLPGMCTKNELQVLTPLLLFL